jgi:hypothetical protein
MDNARDLVHLSSWQAGKRVAPWVALPAGVPLNLKSNCCLEISLPKSIK